MEIVTTRNGGRLSTSVEGTLTGRGGDVIIIDDPIKPDATMSEAERVAVNEWYRRTLYSRLNSKRDGRIVIVMQRLHEDDLVGSLLEEEPEQWDVLRIPATASEPMTYRIGDAPDDVYHRAIGEVIDPRREDAAELERIQHRLGSINFTAQYQQEPQPFEGNMVKREWFRTCENPPDRNQLDGIVQSWDTANAAGELNDYSVCTTWGVSGEAYYLLDVFREKLDYPSLRSKAIELAHRYYADVIVVELAGSGQSLRQDLHESVAAFSTGITPRGDKEMRLAAQSALIEQGRVYLPAQAVWLDEFVKEVLVFPGGRHDDQVDSLALFLKYMRRPGALSLPIKRRKARQRRRQRRLVTYGPAPTLL
jgi:predicted phage terminase large subunit-like protein